MEEGTKLKHPDKEIKETTPLNPIEFLPYKFTLQRQLAKQNIRNCRNKKSHLKWGYKKRTCNQRNGRLPAKRAKWNGGNQTIRNRIQNNCYRKLKVLTDNYKELSENYKSMKRKIETINKNQQEMTNTISEIKNTLAGITISLHEAEDWITKLKDKVERNMT